MALIENTRDYMICTGCGSESEKVLQRQIAHLIG